MPVNSNSAGRLTLSTALTGDFTVAAWVRFGTVSGLPVALVFGAGGGEGFSWTFIDGGNLFLQATDCGPWTTAHTWLVWRRVGGTLSLYGCQQGAGTLTFLGEDAFFGTATVDQIDLLGDALFGPSDNITISHLLIWNAQKSDAILLKERWHWHPQETDDLVHFVRMSTPTTAATAELGPDPTVTGTLAAASPKWMPVGDSITSGRLEITDPPDSQSLAGSAGAGSITELASLGFVIDATQAIPGEPMADHVTALGSRLIPALVSAGPGSWVPIFGSINDVFRGDSEDCYDAIVALSDAVRAHGCYPIGIGPTDSSWDNPPTFSSSAIRALVMGDTANFVDKWDVGADGGHYSLTGGDGLHPVSYAGLNTFFKGKLTSLLGGNVPAEVAVGFVAPAAGFSASAELLGFAAAGFSAPPASMAGQLSAIGSAAAGFVAPAAALEMELSLGAESDVSVGLLVPAAQMGAALGLEGSAALGLTATVPSVSVSASALAAATVGMSAPPASLGVTLGSEASVSAGFSAPAAQMGAVASLRGAVALGLGAPPAVMAAGLQGRASAALGFVAPPAELGMQVTHEGVSLVAVGFVAPAAAMAAALEGRPAAQVGFSAPAPALSALAQAFASVLAGFAAPPASFECALEGVPVGGVFVGFVAPAPAFTVSAEAQIGISAGFAVPPAQMGASVSVESALALAFSAPPAQMNMTLADPSYIALTFDPERTIRLGGERRTVVRLGGR